MNETFLPPRLSPNCKCCMLRVERPPQKQKEHMLERNGLDLLKVPALSPEAWLWGALPVRSQHTLPLLVSHSLLSEPCH